MPESQTSGRQPSTTASADACRQPALLIALRDDRRDGAGSSERAGRRPGSGRAAAGPGSARRPTPSSSSALRISSSRAVARRGRRARPKRVPRAWKVADVRPGAATVGGEHRADPSAAVRVGADDQLVVVRALRASRGAHPETAVQLRAEPARPAACRSARGSGSLRLLTNISCTSTRHLRLTNSTLNRIEARDFRRDRTRPAAGRPLRRLCGAADGRAGWRRGRPRRPRASARARRRPRRRRAR